MSTRSWIEQVRECMQEAGFPGYRRTDAGVLGLLLQRPLAIGQLGEALGISRQAARQLADGLVERGYATLGTDDADARRTLVVLTPMGQSYGRAIWAAQDALNNTVAAPANAKTSSSPRSRGDGWGRRFQVGMQSRGEPGLPQGRMPSVKTLAG